MLGAVGISLIYSAMFGYMIWLARKNKPLLSFIILLFISINIETAYHMKLQLNVPLGGVLITQFAHYLAMSVILLFLFLT